MLRSNTNRAKANIRAYITENFTPDSYSPAFDNVSAGDFPAIARAVFSVFQDETKHDRRKMTEQERFIDWSSGLPGIIDTCYFYNRSAVTDLGDILEETQEERNRFTEREAEQMLTRLIYREIISAINK